MPRRVSGSGDRLERTNGIPVTQKHVRNGGYVLGDISANRSLQLSRLELRVSFQQQRITLRDVDRRIRKLFL